MIRLIHKEDVLLISHLPAEVIALAAEILTVLDDENDVDKNFRSDLGGYVIIVLTGKGQNSRGTAKLIQMYLYFTITIYYLFNKKYKGRIDGLFNHHCVLFTCILNEMS
jgi:hypothetical protein